MATAAQFVAFWGRDRWRREYGYWDPKVYKPKGYHRARDIAGGGWLDPVPALSAGRVIGVGFGTGIGYWIAVQVSRNRVHGYCHMFGEAGLPAIGTDIAKMGDLPRLARRGERTGSAWSGEHLHFIVTDSLSGVPNASGWDTNPDPVIEAELAAVANGGSTPFVPSIVQEDDMPVLVRRTSDGLIALLSEGYYAMVPSTSNALALALALRIPEAKVVGAAVWVDLDAAQFNVITDTYSIPRIPPLGDKAFFRLWSKPVVATVDSGPVVSAVVTAIADALRGVPGVDIAAVRNAAEAGARAAIDGATIRAAAT